MLLCATTAAPLLFGIAAGPLQKRVRLQNRKLVRNAVTITALVAHSVLVELFSRVGYCVFGLTGRLLFLIPIVVLMHNPHWPARWLRLLRPRGRIPQAAEPRSTSQTPTERTRLVSLLHDTVGQGLTMIAMQARGASRESSGNMQVIADVAAHSMTELRRVMSQLSRHTPDECGVIDESLADVVCRYRSAGMSVKFSSLGSDAQLTRQQRFVVVRVAREALTNAMKYAPGGQVSIDFECAVDVRLEVVSERARVPALSAALRKIEFRKGEYDAVATGVTGGDGTRMMHRLAAQQGGAVRVGQDGRGFTVSMLLPLSACTSTDQLSSGVCP